MSLRVGMVAVVYLGSMFPAAVADDSTSTVARAADDYARRSAQAIRQLAGTVPENPNSPKSALPIYLARLQLGENIDATLKSIDAMIDAVVRTRDDPFNLHAIIYAYCLHGDKFPPQLRTKVRNFAARWYYAQPISGSLNYQLMRDGAGWIAAQEFPDLEDRGGLSAQQIQEHCAARLADVMSQTVRFNSTEYESPIYTGTDLMALRLLAEFAREPRLQQRAQMTFEAMLLHTAAHWHHGYLISSAGRAKYWFSNNTSPDEPGITTAMAYLVFGGDREANVARVPQTYWLAHPGRALPLDWLTQWRQRLTQTRTVVGTVWHPEAQQHVRKTAWFTDGYGLASERSDGSSASSFHYKESRRTMLKWVSDKPESTFTVLQENRSRPRTKTANAFAYGENPYMQVMQHEGTLLGLWDVPADYGFHRVQAPFTRRGAIVLREERDGWIVCHAGSMLFAFRFLGPAQWSPDPSEEQLDLYECNQPRGAWILETTRLAPFAGDGPKAELERFSQALQTKTAFDVELEAAEPRLTYTNHHGRRLKLHWHPPEDPYDGQCIVDGQPIDYSAYPLLKADGVNQEIDGPLTVALPDGSRRVYDFQHWKIELTQPSR